MNKDYSSIRNKLMEKTNSYVVAAAGCGKTELIVSCVKDYNIKALILTHTNAGVESLKKRLNKNNIIPSKYNLQTIAAFFEKYSKFFYKTSLYKSFNKKEKDYFVKIYKSCLDLFSKKNIINIIKNSYDVIFIDEYQDCSANQHNVIKLLSKYIPCKIFGDPLQSIFDFDKNDHLISWNEVEKSYDFAGELDYPWRWNSNIELGNIINNYRNELLIGKIPNFLNGKNVQVINYSHENIIKKGYNLLNNKGSSCIIVKRKNQSNSIAKYYKGKINVVEEVELKDLKNFVNLLLNEASNNIVYNLINLIKGCFTKTDYLNKYIDKIKKNDLNFTRIKDIYGEKDVISKLVSCFSINDALNLLKIVINVKESNLYRKELILHLFQLFKKLSKEERKDYFNVTERYFSNVQRKNFQNNISHVLLIKGLEFDNCLVVITKDRNGKIEFSEKELYVALSRAKNKLIILY